jgi:hypothetical protein
VSGVGGEEGGSNRIESQWRSQWRGGRQGRRHVTGRRIIADDDCGAPCYWWGLSGGPRQPPDIEVEEVRWRCGGAARRQGRRLGYRRQTGGGLPGGGMVVSLITVGGRWAVGLGEWRKMMPGRVLPLSCDRSCNRGAQGRSPRYHSKEDAKPKARLRPYLKLD